MMESMQENIDDTNSAIDPAEECEAVEGDQNEAELECFDTEEIAEVLAHVDEVFDTMIDMMSIAVWYKDWVLTNGGLGLILGTGYLGKTPTGLCPVNGICRASSAIRTTSFSIKGLFRSNRKSTSSMSLSSI